MKKINLTVNGHEIEVLSNSTINDILIKYFNIESEFIVQINSRINIFDFNRIKVAANDILEVISYVREEITSNSLEKEFIRKKNI